MKIKLPHGLSFPIHMVIFGAVLVFAGFAAITQGNWYIFMGSLMVIAGSFLAATHSVTVIDPDENVMHEVTYNFGFLRTTKTRPISGFPYLTITQGNYGYTAQGISTSVEMEDLKYEICLLGRNHRHRLVIWNADSRTEIETKAKDIANRIGREIVKYEPARHSTARGRR